jgi:hypothetical protein
VNDELTCTQANDLLAAYATDSLIEEERCAFTAHLAECRLHDEELAGYRAVTSRLPSAIPPVEPPLQLRSSLLSSFDSLINAQTESEPIAPRPQRGILHLVGNTGFAYGLAAVAVLVAVLALAGLAVIDTGGEDVRQVRNAADGGQFVLTYLPGRQVGVIDLNLPVLPSGRVYQAWQITDRGPESLGVVANSGATAFKADLSRATNIAFTDEPSGGSTQPTTTPRLVTKF